MERPRDVDDDGEKACETLGGGTCAAVMLKGVRAYDKVSASTHVSNVCVTQRGRGVFVCMRGDNGERRDLNYVVDLPAGQRDGGGGQAEGVDNDCVYSFVQETGDEKEMLKPGWSMKSGKLPLEIDQNQTPRSARGWCTVQSHIQTLRGGTLERGGG